ERFCPVNCGENGSCYPHGTSYWCACANGTILNPKDFVNPHEICSGHEAVKSNPENLGVIYSSEFAKAFKPNSDTSNPTIDTPLNSLTWILIAVTIATVLSFTLGFLFWRCRSKWRGCLTGRTRLGPPAKKTNNTLNPRYASNPNYYSSSHDGNLINILRNLEIARDKISFIHELGEGCFGKVYKGELKHGEASLTVAVKVLKENASAEAEADFQREVEITSGFYHENILPLLGVVMKDTGPMPWMVFEYMKYGDLTDVLRKNSPHLPAGAQSLCKLDCDSLLWIATQVAAGMLYLSQHHFVHRDLATRNCLVGNNLVVKISDFGMSRDIYTCDYYKIGGSRLLPVRWMAPESIMYGRFTLESDVWSYGVLLWEVFTYAKQPYYGHSNEEPFIVHITSNLIHYDLLEMKAKKTLCKVKAMTSYSSYRDVPN
uniref:Protein kinase domain-containing protein n=1 Tax=Strigamia maritima TaxID=126957 RepID=T1IN36_STRMM